MAERDLVSSKVRLLHRWWGALVVALVTIGICAWTWRAWADVFVDFGRELYLPWRVTQGDVLYSDLASYNGPLSVYWNALWWRLFDGATGIILSNFVILIGILFMLGSLLRRMSDGFTATVALLVFVLIFAFGQTSGVGNYEFMSPYSHEATHGFALGLLTLVVLHGGERLTPARIALTGFLLGLVFLTKAELFAATGGAVGLGLILRRDAEDQLISRGLIATAAMSAIPVVAASLFFAQHMNKSAAADALLFPWKSLFGPVAKLPFYRGDLGLGIDRPFHNIKLMGFWFAGFSLFTGCAWLVERALPRPSWRTVGAVFLAVVAVLLVLPIDWGYAGRPLPLLMVLFFAGAILCFGTRWEMRAQCYFAMQASVIAFALLALGKMLLAAKLWHYGFVLAAPALLIVVLFGLSWFPAALRERDRSGQMARVMFLGLFVVLSWEYARLSIDAYGERTVAVGEGPDLMWADRRGTFANEALAAIEKYVGPEQTLLVLPEGISMNYLSRRKAPTKYINFMPPEMGLFSEQAILEAIEASPPDAVLLVHKDTSEYGLPLFGKDYGRKLFAMVKENYEEVWREGDSPLTREARFGVALLERSAVPVEAEGEGEAGEEPAESGGGGGAKPMPGEGEEPVR